MNTLTTYPDGHIEYFVVYGSNNTMRTFATQSAALQHIENTNDHFPSGVSFRKELNGMSILPSDLVAP